MKDPIDLNWEDIHKLLYMSALLRNHVLKDSFPDKDLLASLVIWQPPVKFVTQLKITQHSLRVFNI